MTEKQLYFIALVPPEPIYSEVSELKNLLAREYGSKAGLRSPPHITLHMPFKNKVEKELDLKRCISDLAKNAAPFTLSLNGFGHFSERVIYINVDGQDELTSLFYSIADVMKKQFNVFNSDYKNRGFNPHMTIAFRDLKKHAFQKAWPEFEHKPFNEQFMVSSLCLLKHNGKSWDEFYTAKFNSY
ncbi:2'-5' RNA ligase family protein [Fulvivirga lutea]|uniref:2'-5' RNA ligase family protein n=1 Tax=Fulvivirga lutea TaxID=2810512 RepID=A0A975A1T6_9BACT|nr:2'-5' RNA ligase family protein [Fulvivirga lutea]QSE98171.1 2'-5' RNA ligase family protein [Fulvivirga lutea]